MGRYVPPEHEGVISGNKLHGKHALGNRANKISQGILTVRFEMPYPIWCTTCPKPTIIGQGVRFNAEKKKVGNYYSSPIYSFRMKHVACGGFIEIRTDPKNTAYIVTEGARKRDLGEDKVMEGDLSIMTSEEREKIKSNAFAVLEGDVEDQKKFQVAKVRLEELEELSEQRWDDPYLLNKRLRQSFRVNRKEREQEATKTVQLQDKLSLSLDLLPENEEDVRRAGLVDFSHGNSEDVLSQTVKRPLFPDNDDERSSSSQKLLKKPRAVAIKEKNKKVFAQELRGNTRATIDPFLSQSTSARYDSKPLIPGIKRKRVGEDETTTTTTTATTATSLVDYDSA